MAISKGDDLALFHKLWTKAVGTPGYVKAEWTELWRQLSEKQREPKPPAEGTVDDWAAKAARHVLNDLDMSEKHASRIAAIISMHAQPIIDLLGRAAPAHSEDCAYVLSADDEDTDDCDDCDCLVSGWDAKVRKATQGRDDL